MDIQQFIELGEQAGWITAHCSAVEVVMPYDMPQWLVRDYLARRGLARFHVEQITPSRCSLLGYSLRLSVYYGGS